MKEMLGDELPAFLAALSGRSTALRVNPLRLSADRFEEIAPFDREHLAYPSGAYLVPAEERPGRHPYHAAGLYYIQDPGAMVVGALAGARPGERVLDLSAAPGGKTTLMAGMMDGAGVLVANDVVRSRAAQLAGNLERCGVTNAIVTVESVARLVSRFGAWFDRVLVDAPCSGESMFAKSEAARTEWTPDVVLGCARRQMDLLLAAGDLVRPGGVLVYSTCTFSREENEDVVEDFLARRPDFSPEALPFVAGASPAGGPVLSEALSDPDGETEDLQHSAEASSSFAAYRLWPHHMPGAGHFVAALRRVEGMESRLPEPRSKGSPEISLRSFRAFFQSTWPDATIPGRIEARGSTLFAVPSGVPDVGGLNVLRPGVELGTIHGDRFEPAHSLALAIPPEQAASRIDLPLESPDVLRYLTGHTIEAEGPPGWWPVTVDGFALGWGKRVGSTIKNHYPKGLRWPS
jgi:16S rRNA C967 or C1407 C5-methylase (RsmB/RsmF family)/NOL1/NOP2/fmu family ribosome biogenesis protein